MGAVATFDPEAFKAMYPEFATVPDAQLVGFFARAGLYLANDGTGPVQDVGRQGLLMGLLVAHMAKLYATVNGVAPSGLVGRISGASEGSVSVSVDASGLPGGAAWFTQTPYGFDFWNATAVYRTARYVRGPASFRGGFNRSWGF